MLFLRQGHRIRGWGGERGSCPFNFGEILTLVLWCCMVKNELKVIFPSNFGTLLSPLFYGILHYKCKYIYITQPSPCTIIVHLQRSLFSLHGYVSAIREFAVSLSASYCAAYLNGASAILCNAVSTHVAYCRCVSALRKFAVSTAPHILMVLVLHSAMQFLYMSPTAPSC